MAKRPRRRPNGYLSPLEVSKKAREHGIMLNPLTLSMGAKKGNAPFGEKIPGKKTGVMFPEGKFMEIIKSVPARGKIPEGSMTSEQLIKIAKKKGHNISYTDIQRIMTRMMNNREPAISGLANDSIDGRRRVFIPKGMAHQILKEEKRKKNLPRLLEKGAIIPLTQLAEEAGIYQNSIYGKKYRIKKTRIAGKYYVTKAEAKRFKEAFKEATAAGKEMKNNAKQGKARKTEGKGKAKGNAGRTATRESARARKPRGETLKGPAETWFRENKRYMTPGQKKLIERVIHTNRSMPLKKFEKELLPTLERILYR